MENSGQHWIPVSYLTAWCDPKTPSGHSPYVWRFNKDGTEGRAKSPRTIFRESDMYTRGRKKGQRDLSLEKLLGRIETNFSRAMGNFVVPRNPLSPETGGDLLLFIAAMHSRTRANRDHWKEQWGRVDAVMDELAESMKHATPERRKAAASIGAFNRGGPTHTHEEVKSFRDEPLQHMLPSMIDALARSMLRLKISIACTNDFIGFITSDSPCVWYDPAAYKRPPMYRAPALMYPTIEITLPLAPTRLLVLTRHDFPLVRQSRLPSDMPVSEVDEFNRRARFHCDEHFVSNLKHLNPYWLDPGVAPTPEDAD